MHCKNEIFLIKRINNLLDSENSIKRKEVNFSEALVLVIHSPTKDKL